MDNFGRYENITVDNGAGLGYVYSNRKLSGIQRKAGGTTTLSYSFGYDAFGNTTQLKAGSKTLAGYTYAPYGKVLTATGAMSETNPLRYRGYYYDSETGFYYLQSRYYDPTTCRFINADAYTSTGQVILGHNMFAYCGNSPISRVDIGGFFWGIVFDVVSLVFSVVNVATNPSDPWAWVGLAGDIVDVLVLGVSGVGEVAKAAGKVDDVIDGLGDLSQACEYGIKAYNELRNLLHNTGLQAHHIIGQRLVKHLGIDLNKTLSVAVTSAEHQKFTNAWRSLFGYGMDYSRLTINDIWEAAQKIYKDYPDLLDAAKKILFG